MIVIKRWRKGGITYYLVLKERTGLVKEIKGRKALLKYFYKNRETV